VLYITYVYLFIYLLFFVSGNKAHINYTKNMLYVQLRFVSWSNKRIIVGMVEQIVHMLFVINYNYSTLLRKMILSGKVDSLSKLDHVAVLK